MNILARRDYVKVRDMMLAIAPKADDYKRMGDDDINYDMCVIRESHLSRDDAQSRMTTLMHCIPEGNISFWMFYSNPEFGWMVEVTAVGECA